MLDDEIDGATGPTPDEDDSIHWWLEENTSEPIPSWDCGSDPNYLIHYTELEYYQKDCVGMFNSSSGGNFNFLPIDAGVQAWFVEASMTKVDFHSFGQLSKPTPELDSGGTVDLSFGIPSGAFDPDLEFKITVDSDAAVSESNEGNNSVADQCLG